MNTSTISKTTRGRNTHPETIPPSVHALDRELNLLVATASTDAAQNRWFAEKLRVKRRLATLPDWLIEAEAVAELAWLKETN